MSATGLDLPVLMSEEHIRRREFVVGRRGYDTAQVREFLEHVADQVRQLETMVQTARAQGEAAARAASTVRTDPYGKLADRVAGVLRAADQEADGIRREAKKDAERILAEARADAERILADAEAAAEELRTEAQAAAEEMRTDAQAALREAREQANRTIDGLSTKREALVGQLSAMQERLVVVARDLESAIGAPTDRPIFEGIGEPTSAPSVWATEERSVEPEGQALGASEGDEAEATPAPPDASAEEPPEAASEEPIVLHEAQDEAEVDAGEPEGDLDDDAEMAVLDRAFEGLWEGADPQLELPDIPPLDLDWGDLAEDDSP